MQENNKLTAEQITSMSEVVAKYMEYECRIVHDRVFILGKPNSIIRGWSLFHSSWDWIHEVWGKIITDDVYFNLAYDTRITFNKFWLTVERSILSNIPIEAFISLYNAIVFINQNKNL